MAPKGQKRLRRAVLFDEPEESDAVVTTASPDPAGQTLTEAQAEAVPAPAATPVRVFRRPVPTTPATHHPPSQTRREETHRCDPHIPTNAATGLPSTGMFLLGRQSAIRQRHQSVHHKRRQVEVDR